MVQVVTNILKPDHCFLPAAGGFFDGVFF